MSTPQHFKGRVTWIRPPHNIFSGIHERVPWYYTEQVTAIARSGSEFLLDITFDTAHYVVHLCSLDKISFQGGFDKRDGASLGQGQVACRRFENASGCFLYGHWIDDPSSPAKDIWWADLLLERNEFTDG